MTCLIPGCHRTRKPAQRGHHSRCAVCLRKFKTNWMRDKRKREKEDA